MKKVVKKQTKVCSKCGAKVMKTKGSLSRGKFICTGCK